eukprot:scaffold36700_cov45-Prasinocladus_malaysianus.AAC.1
MSLQITKNDVDVDGVPCAVKTASPTRLICMTGPWNRTDAARVTCLLQTVECQDGSAAGSTDQLRTSFYCSSIVEIVEFGGHIIQTVGGHLHNVPVESSVDGHPTIAGHKTQDLWHHWTSSAENSLHCTNFWQLLLLDLFVL